MEKDLKEAKKLPNPEMREVAVRNIEQMRKSTREMIASFRGTYKMMLASEVREARLPGWG